MAQPPAPKRAGPGPHRCNDRVEDAVQARLPPTHPPLARASLTLFTRRPLPRRCLRAPRPPTCCRCCASCARACAARRARSLASRRFGSCARRRRRPRRRPRRGSSPRRRRLPNLPAADGGRAGCEAEEPAGTRRRWREETEKREQPPLRRPPRRRGHGDVLCRRGRVRAPVRCAEARFRVRRTVAVQPCLSVRSTFAVRRGRRPRHALLPRAPDASAAACGTGPAGVLLLRAQPRPFLFLFRRSERGAHTLYAAAICASSRWLVGWCD